MYRRKVMAYISMAATVAGLTGGFLLVEDIEGDNDDLEPLYDCPGDDSANNSSESVSNSSNLSEEGILECGGEDPRDAQELLSP